MPNFIKAATPQLSCVQVAIVRAAYASLQTLYDINRAQCSPGCSGFTPSELVAYQAAVNASEKSYLAVARVMGLSHGEFIGIQMGVG